MELSDNKWFSDIDYKFTYIFSVQGMYLQKDFCATSVCNEKFGEYIFVLHFGSEMPIVYSENTFEIKASL